MSKKTSNAEAVVIGLVALSLALMAVVLFAQKV